MRIIINFIAFLQMLERLVEELHGEIDRKARSEEASKREREALLQKSEHEDGNKSGLFY